MKKDDMIYGVRWGFIEVVIILAVLMFLLGFVVGVAQAANQSILTPTPTPQLTLVMNGTTVNGTMVNGTLVPVPTPTYYIDTPAPTPTPVPKSVRRIEQGGCVVIGETIDISGIGWYTGYISYFDKYRTSNSEGMNATKIYTVAPHELRHYFIDPAKFNPFPGRWYSHYETVESGNSVLFYVSNNCTPMNKTNLTIAEKKVQIAMKNTTLPPKTVNGTDVIISRNSRSIIETDFDSRYWIFGDGFVKEYYDKPVDKDGLIVIPLELSNMILPGIYTIIDIYPGANIIVEETYDKNITSISSPFRGVDTIDIGSLDPIGARELLEAQVGKSIDDSYTKIIMKVEDPSIELKQLDNIANINGTSSMALSGYTNANVGSKVTIELDKGEIDPKLSRANTWQTVVVAAGGSDSYRAWYKTVTIKPGDFVSGVHTLTLTTDSGASVNAPMFIRKELEENYKPPTYIQYVDNNPFIPTPTPIIVTQTIKVVETKIVTETIQIPVDYETLSKYNVEKAVPYVIAGIICLIVTSYAIYVASRAVMTVIRTRKEKKDLKQDDPLEEESFYEKSE